MTKRVKVNGLILDYGIYPRANVDPQHVGYIMEAMQSSAILPPVIADQKTKKVIDGFHRCKAALRLYGEDAEIDVEFRAYSDDKEAFLDCVRMNARHGKNLDRHDRVHCAIVARDLSVPKADLAHVLCMSTKNFKQLIEERMAHDKTSGNEVALKRTVMHLAGKPLTKTQQESNERLSGMTQAFYVNQVILLLETDGFLQVKDEKLMARLVVLYELLEKLLVANK